MKGMQNIKRGRGFGGVLSYALDKGVAELIGGNMGELTPKGLAREFGASRALRTDIGKPVWHNSLRLPAGQQLTHDQWCEISDSYMTKMGFSDVHQRVYVLHDEPEGQHVHIIASRIGLDGQLYLGRNENLISTRHIQDLELQFGLEVTKGPTVENGHIKGPDIRRPTTGEMGFFNRTGEKPPRYRLTDLIDEALREEPTAVQFVERLQAAGVEARPNFNKSGLNGFSFKLDGVAFKGSSLGEKYKGKSLVERGLSYEQGRDYAELKFITSAIGNDKGSSEHSAETRVHHDGVGSTGGRGSQKSVSNTAENKFSRTKNGKNDSPENKIPGIGSKNPKSHANRGNATSSSGWVSSNLEGSNLGIISTGDHVLDSLLYKRSQELREDEQRSIAATQKGFSDMAASVRKVSMSVPGRGNAKSEVDQVQRKHQKTPENAPRKVLVGDDLDAALQGLKQAPSRIQQYQHALAEKEHSAFLAREKRKQRRESETPDHSA